MQSVEILRTLLLVLLVTIVTGFPAQTYENSFQLITDIESTDTFKSKRSNVIDATRCLIDEEYNAVCYFCGRFYDSIELYDQCCGSSDNVLKDFCLQVYS